MATEDKKDQVKEIPTIQPDKADIEESLVQQDLKKSKPVDKTPPKESSRQYAKKVGDYNRVVEIAKEKGVDMDNVGEMPLIDSDKGKITEAVKSAYGRELATGIQGISDSITAPKNEERNKLDTKKMMEDQKRIRKAKWADALYAFGEGLQGKTANSENFVSTRIQRKQDKEFQDFKDTTERNQKTKYLWENQTRKEMVDWAEEQAKNARNDEQTRLKFQQLADQYKQNMDFKDRDFSEKQRHNKAMENKKSGSGEKEEKTVKIQTAQKTYELKPEEAAFYKGEILKKAETLRKKYPGWFTETQSSKLDPQSGQTIYGPMTYKLNPEVSDSDMIRAYLENKETPGLNEEAYEQNKSSYFDKYRKEKGISMSPASEDTKPQSQKPKADPLGLGL